MALNPGAKFGPYTVLGPLGRGGMASVYKCHEPALDRHIALKVLPREFLHDESFAERFRREAKVIARLEHPNIVPIHAYGIEDGIPWMAMRCISGGSLSGLLKNRRLDERRVLSVLRGVAEALDHAHSQGVVTATSSRRTSSWTRPAAFTWPTSGSQKWRRLRAASPRRG